MQTVYGQRLRELLCIFLRVQVQNRNKALKVPVKERIPHASLKQLFLLVGHLSGEELLVLLRIVLLWYTHHEEVLDNFFVYAPVK